VNRRHGLLAVTVNCQGGSPEGYSREQPWENSAFSPDGALRPAYADRLRRVLGPIQLTSLGVGAIIGAGIFVATGAAARNVAGPALMLSYVVAGMTCVFAALCYAEFASMVPVAGSAYTYAYATVGEIFAWIIGWDLILEYGLSVATVAVGWSGYFVSLARDVGIEIPAAIAGPPGPFNLPAAAIVALVAALLVIGIKQSADANTLLVGIKAAVLLVFVVAGASYVNRANLTPFVPHREPRELSPQWPEPKRGPFPGLGQPVAELPQDDHCARYLDQRVQPETDQGD
jgi:amino acid transporter